MYRLLEHRGHDVRLFAERCSSVPTSVSPPSALPAFLADAEAVLIYHHSEAWSQGLEAVRNACCKRIVKHHDVPTLHGVDVGGSHLGERVRAAHRHAEDLARLGCNRHLVPSLQTQRELIDRGVAIRNIHLVPDFHRLERVHGIEADVALLGDCRDGRVNVLCAGPLVPRRGQDVALAAFAAYHHRCNPDSRLVIVGAEEDYSRGYAGWLRRQAAVQGVKNAVVFAGAVSEAVLKSYYLAADVFLLTSADEGFCLRVLQAMALKVPVVAVGSTGVPDMLGQAGLVWQEPDVDVLAESIHALVEDKETAAALGFQAWERYQELFTNDRTAARFLHALEEFL